jgi:hypothetical protein
MVSPPATSEAGARRPAIFQLEQFKEASLKPAQLYAFRKHHQNQHTNSTLAEEGQLMILTADARICINSRYVKI